MLGRWTASQQPSASQGRHSAPQAPRAADERRDLPIYLSVDSGICTTLQVILAFASAFLGIKHEFLFGVLFVIALGLLGAALFAFAREVRIPLSLALRSGDPVSASRKRRSTLSRGSGAKTSFQTSTGRAWVPSRIRGSPLIHQMICYSK
jgi:hypothetical protein